MTGAEARTLLEAADAQREALRAAVEAEALPGILAAWDASPGHFRMFNQYMRVGLVERRKEVRGVFDLVWLDYAVWRPFAAEDLFLRLTVDGWRLQQGIPKNPLQTKALTDAPGVVWLREVGSPHPQGYRYPWIHCGTNQWPGSDDEGRVDHMEPDGDVDRIIYPAACAWIHANGGPVMAT